MLNDIYENRREYIEAELRDNIKIAERKRLDLIRRRIHKFEKQLASALFTVNEMECRRIISDLAIFPSITDIILYDLMVNRPFIVASKNTKNALVFSRDKAREIQNSQFIVTDLYNADRTRKIGYLKIFYDNKIFTEDSRNLLHKELINLEKEFEFATLTVNNNSKKQLLGLLFIFIVLYAVIYLLFSRLISNPIKKLEHNLKNFFDFLSGKEKQIELQEISRVDDEFGRMCRFINNGIKISIRTQQELEKHAKEVSKLAEVLKQSAQSIIIVDLNGNIEYVNKTFEKTTGYSFDEVRGKNPRLLQSGQQPTDFYKRLWETIKSGKIWQGVFSNRKKDGTLYDERCIIFPLKNSNGDIINYAAVKQDITKERVLERQLFQAQKMECIGTLAGGIAHDFNNLLTVINGFVELTLMQLDKTDPLCQNIEYIFDAGKKAQTLVSQLLLFSRKQVYNAKIIDLNQIIVSTEKMVRRLIGEDILIETDLEENLPKIKADISQVEQILINLVVNSRDALENSRNLNANKKIVLKTGSVFLDKDFVAEHPSCSEGLFVYFTVSDNGTGMDEETRQRIFEPFFTTKEKHKGTGLGLAMIYGIVKQNNGCIQVSSIPDQGTQFKIYWPVTDKNEEVKHYKSDREGILDGSESILIVEDQKEVCDLAKKALVSLGYTVHTAENGRIAVDLLKGGLVVDLIITDLIMPEMNGKEMIRIAKKILPDIKAVFVSGYPADHVDQSGVLPWEIPFIPKPYSIEKLSSIIRKVLDEK